MALQGIDHIVVRVRDFEQGVASYRDGLGLALDRITESEDLGIKQAFFNLPQGGFIEVVSPTSPDSAVGKAIESRGEGIHSIVFSADDVASTAAAIKESGGQLIGEGQRQVFVHPKSTHGVLVQLTPQR
ncbi:MAG: methylmalonyl-CoA/ethylmalonyl-CoA epimerase [Gammaproteobacteria bacterium]|jgi:methylmalonyl-CoA/ethylmalonyl-CoA epimerase